MAQNPGSGTARSAWAYSSILTIYPDPVTTYSAWLETGNCIAVFKKKKKKDLKSENQPFMVHVHVSTGKPTVLYLSTKLYLKPKPSQTKWNTSLSTMQKIITSANRQLRTYNDWPQRCGNFPTGTRSTEWGFSYSSSTWRQIHRQEKLP